MDNKLQELTDKLFQEGVEKGNQEAEKIVAVAKLQADEVLNKAKAEAQKIVEEAKLAATELDKNTRSELKLATVQLVNSLKQEITEMVNGSIVGDSIKSATADKEFVKQLLLRAVQNWVSDQSLLVVVPERDQSDVEAFFANQAKALLDKNITIETANKIKAGFQIGPADGSYKVSFTDDDFIRFFKEFLRPKVVELLFEQKK
jgi:V/A-type H+/Na+-transporting ATPase subunit E